MRDLGRLPKANLHLHLTGAMRPATLAELADRSGLPGPPPLRQEPGLGAHDWDAFQSRYDTARAVLRTADDVARIVEEAVADDRADGAGWVELQVDPSSYAERLGGLEAVVETVTAAGAGRAGIVLASSWARSPDLAVTVARLAARYAGRGVVGFGLSNDERRGRVDDFAPAFRIATGAGLVTTPHSGFYLDAAHVRACVEVLGATRLGHGLRGAEDPATLELLAERGVTLELCPTSYPSFGVCSLDALPVRTLLDAGVPVALGTDDPLLFGAGLTSQYGIVRALGLTDADLAHLARTSIRASAAPAGLAAALLSEVDAWLAGPAGDPPVAVA